MKNAYKSIIAIVLVSLFVSLLSVSVAMPASAQENFIVIIDQDKIFTTSNFHNSEIKVAPNHPRQGRPSVIDAISDSQEAASHILSERYQEGYAKGWAGGDGSADSQCYVLVRDIKIGFVQPPVASISISTNIEGATFTISGPAKYSIRGTSWSKGDAPVGTYTITYGAVSGYRTPPSETKTLIAGESITFSGDYLLKKRAGDSIDFGDGYILFIRNVDPERGEVSIELQLDDRTIDDKILRKGETYTVEKYNEKPFWYNIVDIYHRTTGDYVILDGPYMYCMVLAHFNLIVSSVPQRADMLIDEQYVGKTPKTIPVTNLEMHSLRLELSGYEDWEGTFKFEQGEGEKEMPITLSKIEPTPTITPSEVKTPSAPRDLLATPGDGYVNLNWNAPGDDGGSPITNYNIYRGTTSGGETLLAIVDNVITYSDTSVTNNQKYYYQVSAVNSAGEGARSSEVSVSAKMLVPHTYSPTPVPGFLAITFILAILCGYLILKKWN